MERLVGYPDPAAFRARVEEHLLAHEAENNLLFGILSAIERGRIRQFWLRTLERSGEVVGVAICTPPMPVVLAHGSPVDAASIAGLLDEQVPGVNAEARQARAFADAYAARTGMAFRTSMRSRIYRLRSVRAPVGIAGGARTAEQRDHALLRNWYEAFTTEALPADTPKLASPEEQATVRIADASMLLWEVDGEPVSMAGFGGRTPHGIRVGPVYTPAAHRRHGYASGLVAELSQRQLDGGLRFCFLYTDLANPTSNSVYRAIGYEAVCDTKVYRFEPT